MQALVVSAGTSTGLALRQVQAPQAEADQHLIRVLASSINRGERTRLAAAPEGHLFGWDVVGEVVTPAALAPATPIGTVVVGLAGDGGGWAEQVAIRASDTAPLNENVPIAVAAALPVCERLGFTLRCSVPVSWSSAAVPSRGTRCSVPLWRGLTCMSRFVVRKHPNAWLNSVPRRPLLYRGHGPRDTT
jgi:hypothetical protein